MSTPRTRCCAPGSGRLLGDDGLAQAEGPLKTLAAEVMGPLRAAHVQAETHPPVLHLYDGWGARVDRVEVSAGWERLRVAAAEHAVVALPYLAEARQRWGAGARVVQHALLHLYGPESATFTCPGGHGRRRGRAALARRGGPGRTRRVAAPAHLHRPGRGHHQRPVDDRVPGRLGRRAGDDLAIPAADGSWRVQGEKWFCSAIDSAMAVALARPHGMGSGSRTLAPFLIPRYNVDSPLGRITGPADSTAPGIVLHRLKDKLGTRAVPTAEVAPARRVRPAAG